MHSQFSRISSDVAEFDAVLRGTGESKVSVQNGTAEFYGATLTPSIHSLYSPCEAIRTRCPSALSPLQSAMSGSSEMVQSAVGHGSFVPKMTHMAEHLPSIRS